MHIHSPDTRTAFHSQVLRATRACQDLRAAIIEIGAIAAPEGDSEYRALDLLEKNAYSVLLLLAVIAECSVDRMAEDILPNIGFKTPVGGTQ